MSGLEHQLVRVCVEVTLVALVVTGLTRLAGKKRARLCGWLWLLVPLKACLVFIPLSGSPFALSIPDRLTTSSGRPEPGLITARPAGLEPLAESLGAEPAPAPLSTFTPDQARRLDSGSFPILPIWLSGLLAVLTWHLYGRIQIRKVRSSSIRPPPDLARLYREEVSRCGLKFPPTLIVNTRAVGPLVTCGLRPFLLLPVELVEHTIPSRMRWILRHELVHIRHLDHLSMVAWSMAEAIFWFHPAIWWAHRQWRHEMEKACDDAVAGSPSEARHYAEALYSVLVNRLNAHGSRTPLAGLAATRTEIGNRIGRLLRRDELNARKTGVLALAAWGAGAIAVGLFGFESVEAGAGTAPSARTELKIDFGPDDQRVEPGWERWSDDRDQDYSCGFDLKFEIEIDRGPAWRDNGALEESIRWGSLLRDGMRERDDDAIRIKLKGLDAGDYLLELYSFNGGADQTRSTGRFDLVIDGRVMLADQVTARRGSTSGAKLPPVTLSSDGHDVVVELARREGEIWLNGLVLSGPTRWSGDIQLGKINLTEAPDPVQATIARELADAKLDDVRRRERNGDLVYSVDADTAQGDLELEIQPDGVLVERSEEIAADRVPEAIARILIDSGKPIELRRVRCVTVQGQQTYEIDTRIDGERQRLVFDPDGTLISGGI
ncbi:MAG: M56 family metallopeptidase [Opitutaceae bacterium]